MSFDLPRRPVSLRFSGEVKALEPAPKNPLGRERPKTAPPPPPVPVRAPDLYTVEIQPTPFVASRPSERAERVALPAAIAAKSPEIRGQIQSLSDEDLVTEALDRGDLGLPSSVLSPRKSPNLPVPHFRSMEQAKAARDPTIIIAAEPTRGGPFSLTAWLLLAILMGVASYYGAPPIFTSLEHAAGLLEAQK